MNSEINIFEYYTDLSMAQFTTYPPIMDEPTSYVKEDTFWKNIKIGLTVAAALAATAVCVAAIVLTGGAATIPIVAFLLAGGAVGTGLLTTTDAVNKNKRQEAKDTSEFVGQLGAVTGAMLTTRDIIQKTEQTNGSPQKGPITSHTLRATPNWKEGWNQEGFFQGTWWQDESKLTEAEQWLIQEAIEKGGINLLELTNLAGQGDSIALAKINAIQALTNALRTESYDEQTFNALQTNLALNNRCYEEQNHTLSKDDIEFLYTRYQKILFKESGNYLERNPEIADGINMLSLGIIASVSKPPTGNKNDINKNKEEQQQDTEEPQQNTEEQQQKTNEQQNTEDLQQNIEQPSSEGNTNDLKTGIQMNCEGGNETKLFKNSADISKDIRKCKPLNSPDIDKWYDKGGTISIDKNGVWKYNDWEGNSVSYPNGYPDFKNAGFVRQDANIGPFVERNADFRRAKELGYTKNIDGTWHHNEDGVTLQDVETIIHKRFTHRGGISLKK